MHAVAGQPASLYGSRSSSAPQQAVTTAARRGRRRRGGWQASGYMYGHDHCNMHVDEGRGPVYVLSGAGFECCYPGANAAAVPAGSIKMAYWLGDCPPGAVCPHNGSAAPIDKGGDGKAAFVSGRESKPLAPPQPPPGRSPLSPRVCGPRRRRRLLRRAQVACEVTAAGTTIRHIDSDGTVLFTAPPVRPPERHYVLPARKPLFSAPAPPRDDHSGNLSPDSPPVFHSRLPACTQHQPLRLGNRRLRTNPCGSASNRLNTALRRTCVVSLHLSPRPLPPRPPRVTLCWSGRRPGAVARQQIGG